MKQTQQTVDRLPISERHVQAIWYDDTWRPESIRTVDGCVVHVRDPGEWNLEAGPDFRQAVLEFGSVHQRRQGDVEIHLRPGDWVAHGHVADPAYQQVIAHVTWYPGPPVDLPKGCVSICLGDFLRTRSDFSPDEIDLAAYPYARLPKTPRPCLALFERDPDLLARVLTAAGRRRLQGKARRLVALFVRSGDRAQVFYEEMMAAFGYKYNAAPFRLLASTVPWADLPANPEAAETAFHAAAEMTVARKVAWHRANVRPSNTPERRLAAAAALFAGQLPELLLAIGRCDLGTRVGQLAARDILCASHLVGLPRAAAMLTNVLIPFALAEGRLAEVPAWIVPEELNASVRLTAFRLLGRDHNPALYSSNGLLIQGLIQVHREFCLGAHPDCGECALVRTLREAVSVACDDARLADDGSRSIPSVTR